MARTGRPPSLGWYEVATFYEAVEQLKARGVSESAAFKAATDRAMSRGAAQYWHRKGKEIIQAKNAALRPLEDAVRPLHDAVRPLANAVGPLANAVRPLHDAVSAISASAGQRLSHGACSFPSPRIINHSGTLISLYINAILLTRRVA